VGQLVDEALAEEEAKELGFGHIRGQFEVIEASLAELTGCQAERAAGRRPGVACAAAAGVLLTSELLCAIPQLRGD
jgi:hypothetical protein